MWYCYKLLLNVLTIYTFMFTSVEIFTMKDRSTVDKQSELLKLLSQFDESLNELETHIELQNVIDQCRYKLFNNRFDQFMETVKHHNKTVNQYSIPQEKIDSSSHF